MHFAATMLFTVPWSNKLGSAGERQKLSSARMLTRTHLFCCLAVWVDTHNGSRARSINKHQHMYRSPHKALIREGTGERAVMLSSKWLHRVPTYLRIVYSEHNQVQAFRLISIVDRNSPFHVPLFFGSALMLHRFSNP